MSPAAREEIEVRFEPSQRSICVPAGTTLLQAARAANLPVANACGSEGICGRCGFRILEGEKSVSAESPRERDIKARNRIDANLRLGCLIPVVPGLVVTAKYW